MNIHHIRKPSDEQVWSAYCQINDREMTNEEVLECISEGFHYLIDPPEIMAAIKRYCLDDPFLQ